MHLRLLKRDYFEAVLFSKPWKLAYFVTVFEAYVEQHLKQLPELFCSRIGVYENGPCSRMSPCLHPVQNGAESGEPGFIINPHGANGG